MGVNDAQGDETLMCESCDTIVRPIDAAGDGYLTCPKCQSSLIREVGHYNDRYDIDMEWDIQESRWVTA